MSKKMFMGLVTSLVVILAGCGNGAKEDVKTNASTAVGQTVIEEEVAAEEAVVEEESDEMIYRRELSSEGFTFNYIHKDFYELNLENYEEGHSDFLTLDNAYKEIVGVSFEEENSDNMYFLIRDKNIPGYDARSSVSFKTILDTSEEAGFDYTELQSWSKDGFYYSLVYAMSTGEGNIVRLDTFKGMSEENSDIEIYETVMTMEELRGLEDDSKLREEIGEFAFHQFDNVSIIEEPLEFENETAKAIIHSMTYTIDYPADSDTVSSYVEIDIEYFPKKDGEVSTSLLFPYKDMEVAGSSSGVYEGISLRETYTLYDTPDLFLEDKLILAVTDTEGSSDEMIIGFEKEGDKQGTILTSSNAFPLAGVESVKYEILSAVKSEKGNGVLEIDLNELGLGGRQYEQISIPYNYGDKGDIPLPEAAPNLRVITTGYSGETEPILTFEIQLKEPDLTVKVKPAEY